MSQLYRLSGSHMKIAFVLFFQIICFHFASKAQYVSVPVTGFNNDIVANGVGATNTVSTGSLPGLSQPTIGVDGNGPSAYSFVDNTYKWYSGTAAFPTCGMPASNQISSALTSGLTYNLQSYSANNAITVVSNTYTGSVYPTTGTATLTTPASFGKLYVLYETVMNTTGPTLTATITFTDASTQVISGISVVNWFTNTGAAYTNMQRAQNVAPGTVSTCGAGPYLFEMQLAINPANYSKSVQSVTFSWSSAVGTSVNTVDYLHVMAMNGVAPCATPIDQATTLTLSSPSGTSVNGSFTAASSAPSGYLVVSYLSGATPTTPVSGTTYTVGASLGAGKIVSVGSATSFTSTGLLPGFSYDYYVYSMNTGICATVYNTASPLMATVTTSSTGATVLINPFAEGGFETGSTLASNGWTVVNSATNVWTVGTVPTGFTNQSAYITNNGGAAWAYTNTSATASHIYKDISFPAGQTEISLSFNWKALGETSAWDALIVYTCPTTITPLAGQPASTTASTANWTGGSPTAIGAQLWNQGTNLQTFTACLPASFAGTTQRIVITWKNDGTAGTSPPGAVDNVSLVSSTPVAPANQATALTLSAISTSQISGSFTAAIPAPTGYLVVRYPNGATPTAPVTGTAYSAGNSLGSGTVIYVGTATTFNSTGLLGGTAYDYYVYDYATSTCAGTVYNTVNPLLGTQATNACGTLSGVIPVGPTAPASPAGFTNLTNALTYINTNGLGGATILELQSDYVSTTETFPITFPFNACVNVTKPLTVRPAAGVVSPLLITTSNATAAIDINGASYITIDGRPGGIGTSKMLSIVNTSTSAISTIRLINDASNNLITYCDVQGASTTSANPTTAGVVYIGGTTGTSGNDNNTISFSDIHSAGATLPAIGVGAYNATTLGNASNNDFNTITNCNIYDFFAAASNTTGIKIDAGNNNYTITNNHLYETASRAFTGAVSYRFLWLNSNSAAANVTHSSGHTVSGNYFGGNNAAGTGTLTITGSSTSTFLGMDISVGNGTGTTVSNDTITNISFQSTSVATTGTGQFSAISVNYGNVNNITNNVVGATGNGITVLSSGATVATLVAGIRIGGGILAQTISGNSVGNINANMTANTVAHTVYGIVLNGGTTSPTITNNNIGPLTTGTTSTTATGSAQVVGISTNVTLVSPSFIGNIIHDLSNFAVSSNTGGAGVSIIGINLNGTGISTATTISGNTIYNLINKAVTTSTTFAPYIQGIFLNAATTATIAVSGNFIHSFSTPNWNVAAVTTTGIPVFSAINTVTGSTVNITNNMIRLGIDGNGNSVTQPIGIRALYRQATTGTFNIYHNSVYVGGTGVSNSTAATQTAALFRQGTGTADNIQNNIFVNMRTNAGSGMKNYAVYLGANTALTLNYNVYQYVNGATNFFGYNALDVTAYNAAWVASDLNSQAADPLFINATGSAASVDLHINPTLSTPVEQMGVNVASVTSDYDGQVRSGLTPVDIGADAGNFTPMNQCSGSPAVGVAALTTTTAICGSGTKTISLSGITVQPGITYQWQESTTGLPGSFVNVSTGSGSTTTSYITGTLTSSSPLFFQCLVGCTASGLSTASNTVQAIVNAAPVITVTPASGTSVCSGSNVDLVATGIANYTYVWSCSPGVTGYPQVSLFSTPNNTAKVTSRPTSTLASGTGNPPTTVATPVWTYTVTATDAGGCTMSSTVVLNLTTAAAVPLQLTYTASPATLCAPGTPYTFTVNHSGTIGTGQWVYNWYDNTGNTLLQTQTTANASNDYAPAIPTAIGNQSFQVRVSNTLCPSSYAVASPSIFVGYTSLNVPTNANCGNNGTITVFAEGNTDLTPWYTNNFTTGLLGAAFDASYGNTNFTGGKCNITPMALSQNGTLLIRNPANVNTNNLRVDFKMSTDPRGFAYNILGADGMAWSYAPDVYQGALTPGTGGFNAESGSGTGFKLAFDATANGAQNTPGAYLMYNCTTVDQGPTSPGVLAFKQGSFWQGLNNAPVSIIITDNGYVTVTVNNEVIFDHVPLPAAYLTANKSNWLHTFTARTGGSNELHAIDDLSIQYGFYEYSINSTNGLDGSWQATNVFTNLAPGTYPTWVRNPNDPNCVSQTGTAVIGVSPSPSSANTVPVSGYSNVVCYSNNTMLTTDVYVPGAVFLWEQASSLAGPWTAAPGTNNDGTYFTANLTQNTYFRLNFTCPGSSTITANPLLVTVNAGSISSTNSPQLVNCIGDNVILSAVPGANTTCVWYTTATGGSPVANGNTYTVAPSSLPATYYVEPVTTIYSNHYYNGGQGVIANTLGTSSSGTGISTRFTTTASIVIDSIKVLASAAGTLNVALQNAGSATNISSVNFTITAAMVGSFVNVPLNLTVPGSGNYQLTTTGVSCAYYSTYSGSYAVSYMSLGGVFSLTGGATSATGTSSTSVYGTAFRWAISTSCPAGNGARVAVQVLANPAFDITIAANTAPFCAGSIQAMTASSTNPYSAYSWTPVTDLYTDAAATIAYVAGANASTVYLKPATGGAKTYTVSTVGSGCTNTKSVTMNVIAAPTVNIAASPASVCQNGNVQLSVSSAGTYCIPTYSTGTGSGDYCTLVSIGGTTLNNPTGASASPYYTLYPAAGSTTGTLAAGTTYTLTISAGTWTSTGNDFAAFIDYNQNGTFEPSEKLGQLNDLGAGPATGTMVFTVPTGANNGTTRFRVREVYANTNIDACTAATYGETEDYNIVITGGITPVGFAYDWSANSTYLSATNISNPVASNMQATQTYTVQVTDIATTCTNTGTKTVTVKLPSSSSTSISLPCGGTYAWGANTYTASGIYTVTTTNAVGCDSLATLDLTVAPCNTNLSLKCYIEGYWDGISAMTAVLANQGEPTTTNACDSIDVELHSDVAPFGLDYSVRTVLQQNGTASCTFPPLTGNKYIVVKHRSALQTWSANPVPMVTNVSYDFSTAATQAYGDNQIEVSTSPSIWAIYSGDVIIDENMDLLDLGAVESDISNFTYGYVPTDLNGDGNVDLLDSPMLEANISNFIYSIHP